MEIKKISAFFEYGNAQQKPILQKKVFLLKRKFKDNKIKLHVHFAKLLIDKTLSLIIYQSYGTMIVDLI